MDVLAFDGWLFIRRVVVCISIAHAGTAAASEIAEPSQGPCSGSLYCQDVRDMTAAQLIEMQSLARHQEVNRIGFQCANGLLLLVPYTICYYSDFFSTSLLEFIKYSLPPTTLGAYFISLPKSHEKAKQLCKSVEDDLVPFIDLMPKLLHVLQLVERRAKASLEPEDLKSLLHDFEELERENTPIYDFCIDVVGVAGDKYRHNPHMMKQAIGASASLRILLFYSLLNLLEKNRQCGGEFCDSKPTANFALFDGWMINYHSYKVFVKKCAEELHANLGMLSETREELTTRMEDADVVMKAFIELLRMTTVGLEK